MSVFAPVWGGSLMCTLLFHNLNRKSPKPLVFWRNLASGWRSKNTSWAHWCFWVQFFSIAKRWCSKNHYFSAGFWWRLLLIVWPFPSGFWLSLSIFLLFCSCFTCSCCCFGNLVCVCVFWLLFRIFFFAGHLTWPYTLLIICFRLFCFIFFLFLSFDFCLEGLRVR